MNPPNPNNDAYNRQVFNDSYRAHEKFVRQWGESPPDPDLIPHSTLEAVKNWNKPLANTSPPAPSSDKPTP